MSGLLDAELRYWRKQSEGSQPASLPCDYPRPSTSSGEYVTEELQIEGHLYDTLQEFCRTRNVTPYTVLLSAFLAEHFRITGVEDATIGVPYDTHIHGQRHEDLRCIRATIREDDSFGKLIKQVQSATENAFNARCIPFDRVVPAAEFTTQKALKTPFVRMAFAVYDRPESAELVLNALNRLSGVNGTTIDIGFQFCQHSAAFAGNISFSRELFHPSTIKNVVSIYWEILRNGLNEPNIPIATLPLTNDALPHLGLPSCPIKRVEYPRNSSTVDLFRHQAALHPQKTAIEDDTASLTYAQLDLESDQLSGWLISQRELTAETLVGVLGSRSCQTVVAFLGILKASMAYVPLDVSAPLERIKTIVSSISGHKLILVGQGAPSLAGMGDVRIVNITHATEEGAKYFDRYQQPYNGGSGGPLATNLAYVMFTSGSTGRPKGVLVEHRGIVRVVMQTALASRIRVGTRMAHHTNIAFDVSTWEIFAALLNGATLVCIDRMTVIDAGLLGAKFLQAKICHAIFTPALLEQCLNQAPAMLAALKTLLVLGDRLHAHVAQKALEFTGAYFMNTYGPTEDTVFSTAFEITKQNSAANSLPIGQAIENSGSVVMDSKQRAVPSGVLGELVVFGDGLARGYLDPKQNEGRFVTIMVEGQPVKAYRTGDCVRRRPTDGDLEFFGRLDYQVKIRGHRVELGEVEHSLLSSDMVSDAVVLMQRTDRQGERLISFVTLRHQHQSDGGTKDHVKILRMFLQDRLPTYMVPAVIKVLSEMPLNFNRKVDRHALAQMANTIDVDHERDLIAPQNEVERIICDEFATILGTEVGVADSFFDLGGHSLMATRLVSRINVRLEAGIAVKDVFEHPIVGELSRLIISAVGSTPYTPIPKLRYAVGQRTEQSFAQGRLWFLDQLSPDSNRYLIRLRLRLRGPLRVAALEAAVAALEYRHESLRTTFEDQNGVGVQVVRPEFRRDVGITTVVSDTFDTLLTALSEEQEKPFNLRTDLGWRVVLYRLSPADHVLSIVMHHIISDGWSTDVLRTELGTFYAAALHDQDPLSGVSDLPVQYRDFAAWQRTPERTQVHKEQLAFWVRQLRDAKPAEFQYDKTCPLVLGKTDQEEFIIDGPLYDSLQSFCRTNQVTPFTVLFSAFRAAQFRITGAEDATIGAPVANRHRQELEGLVGFFVNLQCIRSVIQDETFKGLVQQVQSTSASAMRHQDVPFEEIVAGMGLSSGSLFKNPLVQITFAFHSHVNFGQFTLEGLEVEELPSKDRTRFDMEFHLYQRESCIQGTVLFAEDLFFPETIHNIISVFVTILRRGMAEPHVPIVSLPLLDSPRPLTMNRTNYQRSSSIPDIFRQQALKHPNIIAVKDAFSQMTYDQLNSASDRLCGWLVRQSLCTESMVGVLAGRSCQTVAAFLGVLKANMAYVPLNVDAPSERLRAILSSIPGNKLVLVADSAQELTGVQDVSFVSLSEALQGAPADAGSFEGDVETSSSRPTATSLASVIFTSGSTGKPKGVMIEHRGIVRLAKQSAIMPFVRPGTKIAHVANIAFDASTWEIYTAILNGGTLICLELTTVLDATKLARVIAEEEIRIAKFTPVLLQQYLDEKPSIFGMFRLLISAGDRIHPHIAKRIRECTDTHFLNAYGPTENTGFSTMFPISAESMTASIPIGDAIDNSGAIVMDRNQNEVPLGVLGELVTYGDGLARGYLDPKQNQDRFVHFSNGGQLVRGYRTGDFVRQRPCNAFEFVGRLDHQVKVRGHRIELGEVDHALLQLAPVNDAITLIQKTQDYDETLISFVALRSDFSSQNFSTERDAQIESEEVEAWINLRKEFIYADINDLGTPDIGRDFMGWKSMCNGQNIDRQEMDEWLDDTLRTFLNGEEPGHVLEIGTGTGMILFNLGDGLNSYFGLEPVEPSVMFVTKCVESQPHLKGKVKIQKGTAADVSHFKDAISPTRVIVNSVAQYFPSPQYLRKLVLDLLQLTTVRSIFFGDIRSYAQYHQFLVTMATHRIGPDFSKSQLRQFIAQMEQSEMEQLIDPGFFTSLKDEYPFLVAHVEIVPKRMAAINELSCYRYAAIIHTKHSTSSLQQVHSLGGVEWIDFMASKMNRASLECHLRRNYNTPFVAVQNIPYKGTLFERLVVESLESELPDSDNWISSLRQTVDFEASLSPLELIDIAKTVGFDVEISWARQSSQRGGLDVVFHHLSIDSKGGRTLLQFPTDHQSRSQSSLANQTWRFQSRLKLEKSLLDQLRSTLPAYMMPRMIKIMDVLPRNINQKVDRHALVKLAETLTKGQSSRVRVAPRNEVEKALCEEFAAILGGVDIGITDNFFELGGHSLMATRLASRINKRLNTSVTVKQIFECPAVDALAPLTSIKAGSYDAIPRLEYLGPVEQSFAQGRLWFLDQLYPNSTRYLMPYRIRLQGPLDLSALGSALQTLEYRHETLRTTFSEHDGVGMQVVSPFRPGDLKIVRMTADDDLTSALEEEQIKPFDLRTEPGWRVAVFQLGDQDHVLSIVLHHIISDGWSVMNIQKELKLLYSAALHGRDLFAEMPPLSIQYRDFAVWQREYVSEHDQQLNYWTVQLEGSRPVEFISDKPRPAMLSEEADSVDFTIPGPLFDRLQAFCRAHEATSFSVLLSAFRITHFYLTGVSDATVGSLAANRNRQELEDLIGFFANLQCIRSDMKEGRIAFMDLVHQIKSTMTAAMENEDAPFEQIVARLKLANQDLSRNPLVQTIFSVSHSNSNNFELEGLKTHMMARSRRTRFDIAFHLHQHDREFHGSVIYARCLFISETVNRITSIFCESLRQVLEQPHTPIEALPLFQTSVNVEQHCTKQPVLIPGSRTVNALGHSTEICPRAVSEKPAPRGSTEQVICEEFASVLKTEVGPSDNFFHHGGHSMLATRVISRINRRLRCNVSVYEFFKAATPSALCETITSNVPPALPRYLQHHPGSDSKATLVLIHGIWGQGSMFVPLIPYLKDHFDLLFVDDPFFGTAENPATLNEWANIYVNDIRNLVRRDMPVILGGFSFAGLIVFEMASIWRNAPGSEMISILLLDAGSHPSLVKYFSHSDIPTESLNHALAIFGQEQEGMIRQHFRKQRELSFGDIAERIYEGDGLHIATRESTSAEWWNVQCPRLDTRPVDCTHHEILEPRTIGEVARLIIEHYDFVLARKC